MPPLAAPASTAARPVVRPAPPRPLGQRAGARMALASGIFCVAVAAAMVIEHFQHKSATHPLDHPQLVQMKADLVKNPQDAQLKEQIRVLDLRFRAAHDRYVTHLQRGQWLLLAGMGVFLASLQAMVWRKKIARPGKTVKAPGWQAREILASSAAVCLLGLGTGIGAWWLATSSTTLLTPELAKKGGGSAPEVPVVAAVPMPSTPFPGPEEVARNWGRFRGPGGGGVATVTNLPLTWNVATGENVRWKTKAPGPDFNSPVVWENRLFLSTGTGKKPEVYCYDAATGKLLWQKSAANVPGLGAAVDLPEVSGGFACPTVAADGRRVYAMFANGDVVAFDFNGNLAWSRSFAPLKNQYGHSASLDLWQDRLIVQLDHGEGDEKVARLVALNTADGKVAWETPRETHGTWSTPITVVAAGKPQIITLGIPHVIAYSPADGKEIWRVEGIDGEITPSPILAGGLILAPSPSSKLIAIKPDGAGDVTKTHVAWNFEEGVPDITSPVSDGQRVYMLTTGGAVTCVELTSGKKLWEKDFETEFKASPSIAGDRLYLINGKGTAVILQAGPEFKELARVELGDEITASPAFGIGCMFVRGRQHLICLGASPK